MMEHIEPSSVMAHAISDVIDSSDTLNTGGKAVSRGVSGVVNSSPMLRYVADFLHGKWLGHPLHPVLTDITVGAWTLGTIFDCAAAITDSDELRTSADHAT